MVSKQAPCHGYQLGNGGADDPTLSLGHLVSLLDISPQTIRTYEREGLVKPGLSQKGKRYSQNHATWISCLQFIIQEQGLGIPGTKRLLDLAPCWEIAGCKPHVRDTCKAKSSPVNPQSHARWSRHKIYEMGTGADRCIINHPDSRPEEGCQDTRL